MKPAHPAGARLSTARAMTAVTSRYATRLGDDALQIGHAVGERCPAGAEVDRVSAERGHD